MGIPEHVDDGGRVRPPYVFSGKGRS